MKFTVLSHAGLLVEQNACQLIIDPWLLGSCYWRSWWNYPEPPTDLITQLKPTYIYLTHLHWDHFHGATLKKLFPRDVCFLVPKVHTRRFRTDLKYLGFHNIKEMRHGEVVELSNNFQICSYQSGLVDSACVIYDGETVLLNVNDCKIFGLPLTQVTRRFPRIDFVFRSHSSASPVPYCLSNYEENEFNLKNTRTKMDYIEEFCLFSLRVHARFAVPFASNHCFLHRDTVRFNNLAVSPSEVLPIYEGLADKYRVQSECKIMVPGSSWDDRCGFRIVTFDFGVKDKHIEALQNKNIRKLEAAYEAERNCLADLTAFTNYFREVFNAIPSLFLKLIQRNILFIIEDNRQVHYWCLNFAKKSVTKLADADSTSITIETPALVINDCCKQKMFSVWSASKRLKITLPDIRSLRELNYFFFFLDAYELELFPLKSHFNSRSVGIWILRWREFLEASHLVLKHFVFRRPFVIGDLYK